MKKLMTILWAGVLAVLLSGCQTPAIHAINKTINLGTGLPQSMRDRNVSGVVAFDEAWAGAYTYQTRNIIYTQGVVKGSPEYGMRVVRVNLRHPEWGGWIRTGQLLWMAVAMVPDHIEPLKAGDFVEIRQTGTWHTVEDFVAKGEGNIVVRVLCRVSDPDYAQCLDTLPRIGPYRGFGETGTYYPESIKEYGFTFTPRYDEKGNPLW